MFLSGSFISPVQTLRAAISDASHPPPVTVAAPPTSSCYQAAVTHTASLAAVTVPPSEKNKVIPGNIEIKRCS